MNKMVKKYKISLIINIVILVLVTLACVSMFIGFKFMPDKTLLETTKMEMFKFFTVDSNIIMGMASLILIIYDIKYIKGKIKDIPNIIYILKFISTSAITLTFITTAFFLAPKYGFYAMYNNNNLFFHLIIPVLSIVSYVFFEGHISKYRHALLGIIPMLLYSIYYTSMIFFHINNGEIDYNYDFYGFLQGDINNAFTVIPVIYLFSYIIAFILLLLNNKINNKKGVIE